MNKAGKAPGTAHPKQHVDLINIIGLFAFILGNRFIGDKYFFV